MNSSPQKLLMSPSIGGDLLAQRLARHTLDLGGDALWAFGSAASVAVGGRLGSGRLEALDRGCVRGGRGAADELVDELVVRGRLAARAATGQRERRARGPGREQTTVVVPARCVRASAGQTPKPHLYPLIPFLAAAYHRVRAATRISVYGRGGVCGQPPG